MTDGARARAEAEQRRLLARCREAGGAFAPIGLPRPEDLLAHLERRAEELGPRLALHKGAERVSYGELNARANGLARALVERAGEGAEPVVLLLDSGPGAVVGMLAAWKAGKFFIMLDVAAPPERLAAVLDDTGARLLVTGPAHRDAARAVVGMDPVAILDADSGDRFAGGNPGRPVVPGALACLVYTSGTTGRPKGVMVGFACLATRSVAVANHSGTCRSDREAIVRTTAFIGDMGVVFNALAAGASVHFGDVRSGGLAGLRDLLVEEGITILSPGVSLFRQLAAALRPGDAFPGLRLVRLSGEQVLAEDFELAFRAAPHCVARVGYSSTEVPGIAEFFADGSTAPGDLQPDGPVLPAGFAMPGVDVAIVDDAGREVEPGAPGEIIVRSPGLAQGYWRRPDETATRFVPDAAAPTGRAFRTGDLGRRLDSGMLALLGRADAQVKVRGQRVDPREVESLLRACPGVAGAAVTSRADAAGRSWLCAYLVDAGARPSVSELRAALARRLPDSAIPQRYVFVDAIPVTLHGKVDWRALPLPSSARPELAVACLAPRSPMEQLVGDVWQEMLGVEPVGVRDPFVDLGGDSLRAARVVQRLQERFELDLPATALLRSATVEAMAEVLVAALIARRGPDALAKVEPKR